MARVVKYLRGQTWWVRYTNEGRRFFKSLKTSNRKIAEDRRVEMEYLLMKGGFREKEPVPVQSFLDTYEEYAKAFKAYKTWNSDMGRIRTFFSAMTVGDLRRVSTAMISDYLTKRRNNDNLSPTTILRYRESLHALFAFAIKQSYVESNPVTAVPRPKLEEREPRFLTKAEIKKMLKAVRGSIVEPLARTILYAGLRRSEAVWVTWEDLDLRKKAPLLRIRSKEVEGEKWTTKTKRNRVVPISKTLLPTLKGLPKNGKPWVFLGPGETRWGEDWATSSFRRCMKAAGLPWTFLDLRHTFGSLLAQNGVSLFKIAKLLGNSPEICRRHYAALVPEEMHDEVEF